MTQDSFCSHKRHECVNSSSQLKETESTFTSLVKAIGMIQSFHSNTVTSQLSATIIVRKLYNVIVYLCGVLHRFQHCIGHIMTGNFMG